MNCNTEQLAVSGGCAYLESATRYLEHGDCDSARALVEEGIKQVEASPRFEIPGRLRDLHAIIAVKERTREMTPCRSLGEPTTSDRVQRTTNRRSVRRPYLTYIEIVPPHKVPVEQPTMRILNS
jgi:hypothetical protein